jgi:hypothetical protein
MKTSTDQTILAWEDKSFRADERGFSSPGAAILARSPACFSHAGRIEQVEEDEGNESFSMTNKGLHISLPLLRINKSSTFLALLACRYASKSQTRIALRVVLKSGGYQRESSPLQIVSSEMSEKAVRTRIYLISETPRSRRRRLKDKLF